MVDPVLAARTRRGLPWRCQRGYHKWANTLASKIFTDHGPEYRRSFICRRCQATRHEVSAT